MLPQAAHLFPALGGAYAADHARLVEDADEEIFLLYSLSRPEAGRRGLGYVEVWSDLLRIAVDIKDDTSEGTIAPGVTVEAADADDLQARQAPSSRPARSTVKSNKSRSTKEARNDTLTVNLWQSQTSLRSSRGDTGSVAWRSSILLGATLARQHLRKAPLLDANGDALPALLNFNGGDASRELCVLELGAGTGVLATLLASSGILASRSASTTWVATDQAALIPLLRKNLDLIGPSQGLVLHGAALDWLELHGAVKSAHSHGSILQKSLREVHRHFGEPLTPDEPYRHADLVVCVDCIFNPSLFPAFLDTLTVLCRPDATVAMVLVELREQDMMSEFLTAWINHRHPTDTAARWVIHSLESSALGTSGLQRGYACFIGYLTSNR